MREDSLYLGLDQGGSSSKGLLLEGNGQVCWEESAFIKTLTRIEAHGEAIEHEPAEILDSLLKLVSLAKQFAGKRTILGCGLSLQRSGVLAWQAGGPNHGKSICNIRTWRDSRNKNLIEKLSGHADTVKVVSGLPLTYHFAASKIAELQKLFPSARVGTMDSWLINALGGRSEFWTEESHAARSQLYSLKDRVWSDKLCSIFGVDRSRLPQIRATFGEFGAVEGIPISAVMGDQQAALFGLNTDFPLLNLGTLGQIIVPRSVRHFVVSDNAECSRIVKGYNTGVSYSKSSSEVAYQIEASINCCGEVLDQVAPKEGQVELRYEQIADLDGVLFYPSSNTGSPDWRIGLAPQQKDLITGTPKYNRALLENVAFWISLNLKNLKAEGVLPSDLQFLNVVGGGSRSDYLMKAIASVTGLEVRRLRQFHGSAFGAASGAFFASHGALPEVKLIEEYQSFTPSIVGITERERTWNLLYSRELGRG